MSNNEKDFEVCMSVENVHLPQSGFFGISAATGGLAGEI
jgi:mannose-binding lectin 1